MKLDKKVKKLTKKPMIVQIAAYAIMVIIFISLGHKGAYALVFGPKDINEEVFDKDNIDAEDYVKLDASICFGPIGQYMVQFEGESYPYYSDRKLFLFAVADENFEKFKYVAVEIDNENEDSVWHIVTQTKHAMEENGTINKDKLHNSYEIIGEVREMEKYTNNSERSLYYDALDDLRDEGIDIEQKEVFRYVLDTRVNFFMDYIYSAMGACFLLGIVIVIIMYRSPLATRKMRKYIRKNNLIGKEETLCGEFDNGYTVDKIAVFGDRYGFISIKNKIEMFAYSDVVWVYVDEINLLGGKKYKLNIVLKNKSKIRFHSKNKAVTDELYKTITGMDSAILRGKSNNYGQIYKKDFHELIRIVDERKMKNRIEETENKNHV